MKIMNDEARKEWSDGFKCGYEWCRNLSQSPKGHQTSFFPTATGVFRNAFAEGTIVGRREFNVSWRWVKGNLVEKEDVLISG